MGALLGARLVLLLLAALAAVGFAVIAGYSSEMVTGTALVGVGAVLVGVQSTLTLPLVVQLRNGSAEHQRRCSSRPCSWPGFSASPWRARRSRRSSRYRFWSASWRCWPSRSSSRAPTWRGRSLSLEDLRHLAFTALPVALAAVLTAFYLRILIVMASLLTSEYETGLFVTSSRVLEMIGGLAMLVTGVILPVATVAARDDRPRIRYVLEHTTKLALLAGGLLALLVVVAARPIVVLLGGQEFAAAAPVLRLQAPVVLTVFLVYTWTTFLIADGRRRALVQCMLVGTSALLVTGVPLIAEFDAEGAALAAVVADLVLAAATLRAVRHVGHGPCRASSPGTSPGTSAALAMGAVLRSPPQSSLRRSSPRWRRQRSSRAPRSRCGSSRRSPSRCCRAADYRPARRTCAYGRGAAAPERCRQPPRQRIPPGPSAFPVAGRCA